MTASEPLERLAAKLGILASYRDFDGAERIASPDTLRALTAAMGFPSETDRRASHQLQALDEDRERELGPAERIARSGQPISVPVRGPVEWRLFRDGDGRAGAEESIAEGRAEARIALDALPSGIYVIAYGATGSDCETVLIVAPERAPSLRDIAGRDRLWGMTAALYGLNSSRNLGIGDFEDLAGAATGLARHGAAYLGVNPVHAIGAGSNETISPYSPTSRVFLSPRHIAADAVPDLAASEAARRNLESDAQLFGAPIGAEHVDYETVLPRIEALQEALFAGFTSLPETAPRRHAFREYQSAAGPDLARFASFETACELHGPDSRAWPEAIHGLSGPALEKFSDRHSNRLAFHAWRQWIADQQLSDAARRAKEAGMALGLYLDLAVGARLGGAEAWMESAAIADGISLGAPPDALGPAGQRWNLAAYSPHGLRRERYRPFVKVLRATMRHAGLVRIDHVIGLARSFWIPTDGTPGGYVRYPDEALLAIVAIEAERVGTVVVGEDLGLVPDGFRDQLRQAGLYSYSVMQFEKDADGAFARPSEYEPQSLATFGTHDTPTLRGYETGRDIDWWQELDWIAPEDAAAAKSARKTDIAGLRALNKPVANDRDADRPPAPLSTIVHSALAGSTASIVAVQLDDALGETEAQNLPGTTAAHPNWSRRCAVPVDELAEHAGIGELASLMADAGR